MGYDAGEYLFKVTNQGFGKHGTGSEFFFLDGTPVAVFQDGQEYSVTPYQRTIKLTIMDKTVQYVIDKLTAIGWEGGRWGTLDPNESGYHDFTGQELRVKCELKPGRDQPDKLFENWDLPFGSAEKTENDPSISRRLDAMFGKSAQAAKKAAPKKTADANRAMQEASAGTPDEDIPF